MSSSAGIPSQDMGATIQHFECLTILQGIITPFFGSFYGLRSHLKLVGYLFRTPAPTLYALYCQDDPDYALASKIALVGYVHTVVTHAALFECEESKDVPVYVEVDSNMGFTMPADFMSLTQTRDLFPLYTKVGHDMQLRMVYVLPPDSKVIFYFAAHPLGYYFIAQVDDLVEFSEILNSYPESFLANSCTGTSFDETTDPNELININSVDETTDVNESMTVSVIGQMYPNWGRVLAYCRALLHLSVCDGTCGNPFRLTRNAPARSQLIKELFSTSLVQARIRLDQLEEVISGGKSMTHDDILVLARSWLTTILSGTKRKVENSILDRKIGFDLDFSSDISKLVLLLNKFLPPQLYLPIENNGIAYYLLHQITKEIVYYIVFRCYCPTSAVKVGLVLGDIKPEIFRQALHPPIPTLAYSATSIYSGLLQKLVDVGGKEYLEKYPTTLEVFDSLLVAIAALFQMVDDTRYEPLMEHMKLLCNLTVTDVVNVSDRPKNKKTGSTTAA